MLLVLLTKVSFMLNVANKPFMLSVIMLSVIMLNVVAPPWIFDAREENLPECLL
jgi:hypothetical protein